MSDDTINDQKPRPNPTPPKPDHSRGKGAQEITISPDVGDTSEDLIDRIDDDEPAPRR